MGSARSPIRRPRHTGPIPRSRLPLHRRARMDPRWLRSWILVLAGAVLVAGAVHRAISRAGEAEARWGPRATVLVTTDAVPPGARLVGHVRLASWPARLMPDDALTDVAPDAQARWPLSAGVPLTRAALRTPGRRDPQVRPRIAVPVGEAGQPARPGDEVDVWATVDPSLAGGRLTTHRVADDATVVRVTRRAVVVAVDPADVGPLAEAVTTATITVVRVR